jgi:hypothetical protein
VAASDGGGAVADSEVTPCGDIRWQHKGGEGSARAKREVWGAAGWE